MKEKKVNCIFFDDGSCLNIKRMRIFGLFKGKCSIDIAKDCELKIKHKRVYKKKEKNSDNNVLEEV
jgi:hypothetical protein